MKEVGERRAAVHRQDHRTDDLGPQQVRSTGLQEGIYDINPTRTAEELNGNSGEGYPLPAPFASERMLH